VEVGEKGKGDKGGGGGGEEGVSPPCDRNGGGHSGLELRVVESLKKKRMGVIPEVVFEEGGHQKKRGGVA